MSLRGSPSLTGPESPVADPSSATGPARNAVSFLLASGEDPRRESRRIALGLLTLAVISVALLNFGIYQSAQMRLTEDGWRQLDANTDGKREEIRDVLARFERQALYIAEQPMVIDWARLAVSDHLFEGERRALVSELDRSARSFGYEGIDLYAANGRQLVQGNPSSGIEHGAASHVARRVSGARVPGMAELHHGSGGKPLVMVAIPMAVGDAGEVVAVLICHARVEALLAPILRSWPGFEGHAGAYLVAREGEEAVILSAPPGPDAGRLGMHIPLSLPDVRAAAMAVSGVESHVEMKGADARSVWASTRQLPELEWGLVGQVDRSAMMAGIRGTLYGLLLLDLAMALLAVSAIWFWRRQYASGLARTEMQVTRRHAERVQALFDNAFDAIITFGKNGRVRTLNRAAERLLGRKASEVQNQPVQRFLRDAHTPLGRADEEDHAGPGVVMRSEASHAGGSTIPVEYSLGRTGHGDEFIYTAILRDVSDRVEAEKRIRDFAEGLETSNARLEEMNAQLEEASRLKSEFLANTSHELRTPLNGMIGFLQLVLDGMCDSRDEERDYMKQALQCSRHLLGLINDVLDIAKIEAGKLSLEVGRVDVKTLFDEVYTLTHVQAEQKGIELEFITPEGDNDGARGDFGKIKQVLINLVGNSLKFTPYGRITVRGTPHPQLGHYMFEVIDTGIGIPPERQKVIFDKFTQGDGSTTRRFGGTGLGLAISRSLVELMGGIIGVHSAGEGQGTRMYFSLPVWRSDAPEESAETAHDSDTISGPSGGSLALIVEDDPTFRKYLGAVLNQRGYRTIEARTAESGWLLARRMRPAVVILDYALSSAEGAGLRTGWDLAERMATDEKTRHTAVIFVTGFDAEVRERLKRTAFARKPAHMVKPIDGSELVARIEELVGDTEDRVLRVLMADDDPSVTAYVRKVLPEDRFLVEIATNGEECLHILEKQPRGFDLLLLDLMMPDVSGYDVLREMTLAGTNEDLPVLVLTNFPEPRSEEERRLLEDGLVIDVVAKSRVHENPQLLPHVIDWHVQANGVGRRGGDAAASRQPAPPEPREAAATAADDVNPAAADSESDRPDSEEKAA